jgi:hypothetical protein
VGRINVDALRRDRDQLWAEAATLEAASLSIVLDHKLWPVAHEEQEKRRIADTWENVIENMPAFVTERDGLHSTKEIQIIYQSEGKELVRSADVLVHVLKVQTGQQHQEHGKRLARAMKRCGWQTFQSGRVSIEGKQYRGYWRDPPPVTFPKEWVEVAPAPDKNTTAKGLCLKLSGRIRSGGRDREARTNAYFFAEYDPGLVSLRAEFDFVAF